MEDYQPNVKELLKKAAIVVGVAITVLLAAKELIEQLAARF